MIDHLVLFPYCKKYKGPPPFSLDRWYVRMSPLAPLLKPITKLPLWMTRNDFADRRLA